MLVIDDDETFRYVFRQMIGSEAHYRIFDASDGAQGLSQAHEHKPDIIILDLQMPNVDGFSVLHDIQCDSELAQVPVVVSTSLKVTPELRARIPSHVPVISKSDLSRDRLVALLQQAGQREFR